MSLAGLVSNFWMALLLALLALLALGLAIWQGLKGLDRRETVNYVSAFIFAAVGIGTGLGWHFAATHTVVPANRRTIVVDKTRGQVIGGLRSPGLTEVPMLGTSLLEYPGATDEEFCSDYFPAISGGYEIKATICYYLDGSTADWVGIYSRYGKDYAGVLASWNNQLSEIVQTAVKTQTPIQLSTNREASSQAILAGAKPWFEQQGVVLRRVSFQNWEFTSEAVGAAFDQSINAQSEISKAKAELEAAKARREQQQYEAETQALVQKALAKAQREAMDSLGLTTDDARARWLQIQWLNGLKTPPDTVIVNTGGDAVTPAVGGR